MQPPRARVAVRGAGMVVRRVGGWVGVVGGRGGRVHGWVWAQWEGCGCGGLGGVHWGGGSARWLACSGVGLRQTGAAGRQAKP